MKGLWLMLVVLVACEPPPDVEPLACRNQEPGEGEVGVGNRSTGFIPLVDGEDVEIVFGPQGMHMVVVSMRLQNLELPEAGGIQNRVAVAIRLNGELVGGTVGELRPSAIRGDTTEFLGMRAILTMAEIEPLDGREVEIAITVRDGCGRDIEAAMIVRLWL